MNLLAHLLGPRGPKTPFDDPEEQHRAGRFGLWLFLVSLGVLFLATVIGIVVVRIRIAQQGVWPEDIPALPWGLAASTAIIALGSATMQWALVRSRAGATGAARVALTLSLLLGFTFLITQAACWFAWTRTIGDRWDESDAWRLGLSAFYVLTGLHGLHVIGGLIALLRAHAHVEGPIGAAAIRTCAVYWHFLGVIWLGLLALMLIVL